MAIYTNYLLITKMLGNLAGILFRGITASVGHLVMDNTLHHERQVLFEFMAAKIWFVSFIAWGYVTFSSDLIRLLFGKEYLFPHLKAARNSFANPEFLDSFDNILKYINPQKNMIPKFMIDKDYILDKIKTIK